VKPASPGAAMAGVVRSESYARYVNSVGGGGKVWELSVLALEKEPPGSC
jgi:hypothetical protein